MPVKPSTLVEQPLLLTKISIPQVPPKFVRRPHLTERINQGVMGPLTLLLAPAGFGKTNVLIEWARAAELPVAWLNIDADDNDTNRFFGYLIGALQTVEPRLGEEALDFIHSTRGSGLEVGLTLLINEIAAQQQEMALVLDDFQALEDATILESLNFFLKHLPYNLHLVIASRSEPALDLAALRAKGRVVELRADDLRFTSDEIALFFQQVMGVELPAKTVEALEKRTEGWVTALQMAAVSMRHQPDWIALLSHLEGDGHYLVDFLAEEVLDQQPEEVRHFLLRSSILDNLSGSLCEAVVNPEAKPGYGTVMLNWLERAHLFITASDEKHEWFRYHPLFADFLRHVHAEINPAEIPVLQKRAALWFEENGNLDKAFQYALASGDEAWTADLIERNVQTMIQTGEIFTLTRWIGKLPDEMLRQRPRLSLAYAWGALAAYQLDLARYWIEDVQRSISDIEEGGEAVSQGAGADIAEGFEDVGLWNVRGGLAVCQYTLAILSGDVERAAEFAREATNYLEEESLFIHSLFALDDSLYFVLSGDSERAIESLRDTIRVARRANNLLVMIIATCELAEMQALQGQLGQAWATLQRAQYMTAGPDGEPLPLAGLVDVGMGEILLERNELDEAGVYLERGCRVTQSLWSVSSLDGMVSLAHLRQAQGDIAGSQAIIEEAAQMALGTESSQWDDAIVSAIAVRLALQRSDLVAAAQWWERSGFPDITRTIALEDYPYHVFEYLQLTRARFLLAKGLDAGSAPELRRASEVLETLLIEAERLQRTTSQIEIHVLQAMVQSALGDDEGASATLLRALALGEPEGYRRIYLDEGRYLFHILLQCRAAQQESGGYLPSLRFIDSLLESIQQVEGEQVGTARAEERQASPATAQMDYGIPVSLSAREVEVLTLIAEGKTNQEISAQLYLALNTVKRHASNIYTKLDVRNRTEAVSKARQLGLLS